MGQILIFIVQTGEIALGQGFDAVAFGHAFGCEKSCLSQEDGFHLKEVVAVLAHGLQGDVDGPLLESIAIDAEAEGAGQAEEVGRLPRAVEASRPLGDGKGLLFQPFRLQGGHPGVDGQLAQCRNNLVARGVEGGALKLVIVLLQSLGYGHHELRQVVAVLGKHVAVGLADHVEHHIIIGVVLVVSVDIPVTAFKVQLHVAHPQCVADAHLRIEEVRSCIAVVQSWVDDLHRPSVGGQQFSEWQHFVSPSVVKQFFHGFICLDVAKLMLFSVSHKYLSEKTTNMWHLFVQMGKKQYLLHAFFN